MDFYVIFVGLIIFIILLFGIKRSLWSQEIEENFSSLEDVLEGLNLRNNKSIDGYTRRFLDGLEAQVKNKDGFIPTSKTLTQNSQVSSYNDIYTYWDPNYNYSDYWNYSYPVTVYPRKGAIDFRSFGHSTYGNLFQLYRTVPLESLSPYQKVMANLLGISRVV